MGKNKQKKLSEEAKSEYEKLEEQRVPNHWAYSDDPILNIDPVFTDQPAVKVAVETETSPAPTVTEKEPEIESPIIAPKPKKSFGVLDSIINNAKKKSEDIQNEILEIDPVIAKLAKIEELKKTGGSDAGVYTDTSKSDGRATYAKRAEEFHKKNLKNLPNESELQRKLRLQAEAQRKREMLRGEVQVVDEGTDPVFSQRVNIVSKSSNLEPEHSLFLATCRSANNELDDLENKVKDLIQEIKVIKQGKIEREAMASTIEIENKEFFSEADRKEFLQKRLKELTDFQQNSYWN
ncbi:hypothetical protein SCLARK_00445 [Spiroplasma clarkii]|uniref:hypothetical protein n=1 Tax=Spiroplasma clarkii TaxID=2139 RepID=UPI000B568900|nr:hypothetical protein [Spiroplasma clarkii]ARU91164.1 hypothetical protein SCLARK_00445 [Spiroplasma clarkii]